MARNECKMCLFNDGRNKAQCIQPESMFGVTVLPTLNLEKWKWMASKQILMEINRRYSINELVIIRNASKV